jgi:hypothetical protein
MIYWYIQHRSDVDVTLLHLTDKVSCTAEINGSFLQSKYLDNNSITRAPRDMDLRRSLVNTWVHRTISVCNVELCTNTWRTVSNSKRSHWGKDIAMDQYIHS